jgi:hypothetical protein
MAEKKEQVDNKKTTEWRLKKNTQLTKKNDGMTGEKE